LPNRQQINRVAIARTPAAANEDPAALEVLLRALGGISSPLRREVRAEQGAAYTFGSFVAKRRAASYAGDAVRDPRRGPQRAHARHSPRGAPQEGWVEFTGGSGSILLGTVNPTP
jgi:hypothetical protein